MGKASNGVRELNCHLDWFYIWVFLLLTCILSLSNSDFEGWQFSPTERNLLLCVFSDVYHNRLVCGEFFTAKLVDFGSQWKT